MALETLGLFWVASVATEILLFLLAQGGVLRRDTRLLVCIELLRYWGTPCRKYVSPGLLGLVQSGVVSVTTGLWEGEL